MSNIVEQMVSNAMWGGSGGGGSGLPTGGAAHQMLVTDADGKAEWQELLCYTDHGKVTVLPETVMIFHEETSAFMGLTPLEGDIVIGDVYTITYNGVDYQCAAQLAEGYAFGNLGAVDETFPATNDPFILLLFPPEAAVQFGAYAMLMALDGAEEVTISVSFTGEVVKKKLDAKFAPGYVFGDIPYKDKVFLAETTLENPQISGVAITLDSPLVADQTYTIIYNGTEYVETAWFTSDGRIGIGQYLNDSDCPVGISAEPGSRSGAFIAWEKPASCTVSVVGSGTERILIPDKYIEQAPFIINAEVNLDGETDSVYCDREQIYDAYKANKPIFVYLKNTGSSSNYGMLLPLTYYNGAGGYFFFEQYLFGAEYGYHVEIDLDGVLIFEKIHPNYRNLTLTSPNGTAYKITVSDDGTLSATAV